MRIESKLSLGMLHALLVLTFVISSCGSTTDTASAPPAQRHPIVKVTPVKGAPKLAVAFAAGAAVVGQTWAWGDSMVAWSDDDGTTWHSSTTPEVDPKARMEATLTQVGASFLILWHPTGMPEKPPAIWWSTDSGHSFQAATGVAQADQPGGVNSVVDVDGRLIAFGNVLPAGLPTPGKFPEFRPVRWESTDGGRSWTGRDLTGDLDTPAKVTATPKGTLFASNGGSTGEGAPHGQPLLLRSTDLGRSWNAVSPAPLGNDEAFSPPKVVGDTVFLHSNQASWASRDEGKTWTKLGNAPSTPDDEGTKPGSSTLNVHLRTSETLVAAVNDFFDNDHYLANLAYSTDDGASWRAASMPVHCDGYDASSRLGPIVKTGNMLVATWNCFGGGDHGGWLLTSVDAGRSWQVQSRKATSGKFLSAPVVVGDDHVLVWAGKNLEAAPTVIITLHPAT